MTHAHTRTLGHASTSVHQGHMTCSTRWSVLSAVGDDKSADVACLSDEVMTGCSSRTEVGLKFLLVISNASTRHISLIYAFHVFAVVGYFLHKQPLILNHFTAFYLYKCRRILQSIFNAIRLCGYLTLIF